MFGKTQESIHAEQLWKYLDDLAEKDPEEYQKFIKNQMKQGMNSLKDNNHDIVNEDSTNTNTHTNPNPNPNTYTNTNIPNIPNISNIINQNPNTYNQNQNNSNNNQNTYSSSLSKDEDFLEKLFSAGKKKITVNKFVSLRFKLKRIINEKFYTDNLTNTKNNTSLLTHEELTSNQLNEVPKITFSFEFQSQAYGSSIIQEPKIYLNIVKSSDFYPPLNKDNKPEINNTKLWNYIPSLFRYNGTKKSMSGIRCIFYDCIIHSIVCDFMLKNESLKSSILAYIARKFNIFLNSQYELYLDNVKILSNHTYKSVEKNPPEFLLERKESGKEPTISGSGSIKNVDNVGNVGSIDNPSSNSSNQGSNQSNSINSKKFYEENSIKIPSSSFNIPAHSNTFYKEKNKNNLYNKNNSTNNSTNNTNTNKSNNISIPGIFNSKPKQNKPITNTNEVNESNINFPNSNLTNTNTSKKIIIEEIKQKGKITFAKNIVNNTTMELVFDFMDIILKTDIQDITMNDIDLQISETEIKVLLENASIEKHYDPIYFDFNNMFSINPDLCGAKFDRNLKQLKVKLIRSKK